ncbi:MAG: hypothetical protein ACK4YF_01540 [Exilispira sp.]
MPFKNISFLNKFFSFLFFYNSFRNYYRKTKLIITLLTIILILFSCQSKINFKQSGKITISNSIFELKADPAFYDIEFIFEAKITIKILFINNQIKFNKEYKEVKYLKLTDIDLRKYKILCEVIDNFGISSIDYKINYLKKNYWYNNRYESEPNDSFSTATDFLLLSYKSESKIGRLNCKEDIDFYRIINDTNLDISCNIIVTNPINNFETILYDGNNNIICRINQNLPIKILSKKTYYLSIASTNIDFNDIPYIIIINPLTTLNNLTEFEPNNEINNSTQININQTIFGDLIDNDIDYFSFDIEKEGFYKIIFSSSAFPFSITFITEFGEFYGDYTMHRAGSFRSLLLPKGRYYLKIQTSDNSKNKNISYFLKIENDIKTFEIEPNDIEQQANEFTIHDNITGFISWEYDIDYFMINFEKNENYIILSTEDPFTTLHCEIFVDNNLYYFFDIKEGSYKIKIIGEKVLIKLYAVVFNKEIFYNIKAED